MRGYLFVKWIRAAGTVGVVIAVTLLLLIAAEMALRAVGWGENRSPFIRREANGQIWHVRNFNFCRQFSGIQPRDNFFSRFRIGRRQRPAASLYWGGRPLRTGPR